MAKIKSDKISNYQFAYNCVAPSSKIELNEVCDNMRQISVSTFLRYIPFHYASMVIMYVTYINERQFRNDWSMSFYKYKNDKYKYLILRNSAIEYIFKSKL